jgi:hypothetical protein
VYLSRNEGAKGASAWKAGGMTYERPSDETDIELNFIANH